MAFSPNFDAPLQTEEDETTEALCSMLSLNVCS